MITSRKNIMSSTDQPKPATRSSKRNKRPSSPVLEFLSNARKKRGGGVGIVFLVTLQTTYK